MKNFLNNIRDTLNDSENPNKKMYYFFGFYTLFFSILILVIFFGGDKDYLYQEYEGINDSLYRGELSKNCVFDYKVTIDGVLHDYYGKRNQGVESFKYNNLDYYYDQGEFFVHKDLWVKSDNPYQFYELLKDENISSILQQATLDSEIEEDSKMVYHFLISSNTLNQFLYQENTDYDEEADKIDVVVDSSNHIEKISYELNHFCLHRENCQNTLMIEMNFEMFDSVKEIDNPIE